MLANVRKDTAQPFKINFLENKERNVFQVLHEQCKLNPLETAMHWLNKQGDIESTVTYADMLVRIRNIAHYLVEKSGVKPKDRVVLCYPPGLEFFYAFWACVAVGVIAVPVCPIDPFNLSNDHYKKFASIVEDCEPSAFLSDMKYLVAIRSAQMLKAVDEHSPLNLNKSKWYPTDTLVNFVDPLEWDFPDTLDEDEAVALLQYTSGSTGKPKGVIVLHESLMMNAALIMETFTKLYPRSSVGFWKKYTVVSWLPSFHDMGLIGFHIAPLLAVGKMAYMSPLDFMVNPVGWLNALTKLKHVCTGAPCFALDLCVKKVKKDEMKQLDLSNVSSLLLGASPVIKPSLEAFAKKFASVGFKSHMFLPCYGLAENILLAASNGSRIHFPMSIFVDQDELAKGNIIRIRPPTSSLQDAKHDDSDSEDNEGKVTHTGRWLVASGCNHHPSSLFPDSEHLMIVNNNDQECMDGEIGEIWISGKTVAAGYWKNAEATELTFHGHIAQGVQGCVNERSKKMVALYPDFLRTGDLGVWLDGYLYITGRVKDMIIVNGVNYYPHDIEDCIKDIHPAIRPGSLSAVSINVDYKEQIALLVELRDKQTASTDARFNPGEMSTAMKVGLAAAHTADKLHLTPLISRVVQPLAYVGEIVVSGLARCKRTPKNQQYDQDELEAIVKSVRKEVLTMFGIPVHVVALLKARTLQKTSSGKICRSENGINFHNGTFEQSHKILYTNSLSDTSFTVSANQAHKVPKPESKMERTDELEPMELKMTFEELRTRVVEAMIEELELDTVSTVSDAFGNKTFIGFDMDKNLAEYGLDSIGATRLVEKLSDSLDVRLSVFMFMADPSANGIARSVLDVMKAYNINAMQTITKSSALSNTLAAKSPALTRDTAPCILGIGTAVPGVENIPGVYGNPMVAYPYMAKAMELDKKKAALFKKIFNGTGIKKRHMCRMNSQELFFGNKGLGNDASIDLRNKEYQKHAPGVALKAAEKAITDWGGDKLSITHVIAVTCTGSMIPGLEFHIMTGLGLEADTQRLSIQYMGCFGALSGIKAAKSLCAESQNNRVLLVCCELCSLHMQLNDKVDNLVASALFSDGAGAIIMGCGIRLDEEPIYEVHASQSMIIPNTLDMMAWEMTQTGMIIGLHKDIPNEIYKTIAPFVGSLLEWGYKSNGGKGIKIDECVWANHPGGPMILKAMEDALKIPSGMNDAAWKVLEQYGNMSSATVLFVLDHVRKNRKKLQPDNAWVPSVAFGPGLNVEGSLLRLCK